MQNWSISGGYRPPQLVYVSRTLSVDPAPEDVGGEREQTRTIAVDLAEKQYRQVAAAAALAGKTVEEFAHLAIARWARDVLSLPEEMA